MSFHDKSLHLKIYYDGNCDGEGTIFFTRKIGKAGEPNKEDMNKNMFDLKKECSLRFDQAQRNIDSFSCHAKGNTPLAGAMYKLKQVGTYKLDCGALEGEPNQPRMRYVCVSGCNESTPEYLDKHDPCD
jgi:hypothetical protein